jgi:hypothetical protein
MKLNASLAVLSLAACMLAAAALAQDTPPVSPAPAGEVGSKPAAGKAQPGEDSPDSPPAPAASKSSPQRFEPTEKVRPDFDVAFPVDI